MPLTLLPILETFGLRYVVKVKVNWCPCEELRIFKPECEGLILGTERIRHWVGPTAGVDAAEKRNLPLPGIKSPVHGISHFYCTRLYPDHKQPAMNTAGNKPSRRKLYTASATSVSTHTGSISTYHRHWNSHKHTFPNCGAVNPSPKSQHSTHRISPISHEERLFCRILIKNSTQKGSCIIISQNIGFSIRKPTVWTQQQRLHFQKKAWIISLQCMHINSNSNSV
jgi:hypothetical protein